MLWWLLLLSFLLWWWWWSYFGVSTRVCLSVAEVIICRYCHQSWPSCVKDLICPINSAAASALFPYSFVCLPCFGCPCSAWFPLSGLGSLLSWYSCSFVTLVHVTVSLILSIVVVLICILKILFLEFYLLFLCNVLYPRSYLTACHLLTDSETLLRQF